MAPFNYTSEMLDWVRDNAAGKRWRDVAIEFNARFNTNKTRQQIKHIGTYYKISNKLSGAGHNSHPDGHIRTFRNQVQIKINGKWRGYSVYVYEQTYGIKIDTRKYRIIHLDRNPHNNEPDNLYAFPTKNLSALSWYGKKNTEYTKEQLDTMCTIAEIQQVRSKKKKEIFGSRAAADKARYHSDPIYREHIKEMSRIAKRRYREKLRQQGKPIK